MTVKSNPLLRDTHPDVAGRFAYLAVGMYMGMTAQTNGIPFDSKTLLEYADFAAAEAEGLRRDGVTSGGLMRYLHAAADGLTDLATTDDTERVFGISLAPAPA